MKLFDYIRTVLFTPGQDNNKTIQEVYYCLYGGLFTVHIYEKGSQHISTRLIGFEHLYDALRLDKLFL